MSKTFLWVCESAGKIPPDIWQGFITIVMMQILFYLYGDSIALFL